MSFVATGITIRTCCPFRLWTFLISGFLAGVAGALLGFNAGLATPEAFTLSLSIDYVAMIILGCLGSLGGSLLGVAFVTVLPGLIQRVGEGFDISDRLPASREIALGLLIIILLIFVPAGPPRCSLGSRSGGANLNEPKRSVAQNL
jgi:branched-chain amino acid transport system permease protein